MAEYIKKEKLLKYLEETNTYDEWIVNQYNADWIYSFIESQPSADVVEVESIIEQIVRKKAEASDYWLNDVKQYRSMQGYSDIEHDADNFLRGYNEAVEDILVILDGESKERGGEK